MERTLITDLPKHVGQQVRIRGWYNNLRALGKISFLIVRDRTGLAQIVIDGKEDLKQFTGLQTGTVLTVVGEVVASTNTEVGAEIIKPSIEIEAPVTEVPPLEYYKPEMNTDLEIILDHRPIALRNRKLQAVFKIQAEMAHAYRVYMHDVVGAVEYFPPNMIGASSEGGAEFFKVDYFGFPGTLAQSSQLYKQIMVGVNERVFALAPSDRRQAARVRDGILRYLAGSDGCRRGRRQVRGEVLARTCGKRDCDSRWKYHQGSRKRRVSAGHVS